MVCEELCSEAELWPGKDADGTWLDDGALWLEGTLKELSPCLGAEHPAMLKQSKTAARIMQIPFFILLTSPKV